MAKIVFGRDAILQASDIQIEEVAVPEWGVDAVVLVRSLTAHDRDIFEASILQVKSKNNTQVNMRDARAKLAVLSLCDAAGNRIFTDQDVAALAEKSGKALDRVFEVASRLAGLNENDVDDLTKNSLSAQADDSSFG